MILYCNPSENNILQLWYGNDSTEPIEVSVPYPQAEHMLEVFDTVLQKHDKRIDTIVFVNDAGTFTTIRTLAAICNVLAYAAQAKIFVLQSPVGIVSYETMAAAIEGSEIMPSIVPQYSGMPNITLAK